MARSGPLDQDPAQHAVIDQVRGDLGAGMLQDEWAVFHVELAHEAHAQPAMVHEEPLVAAALTMIF